MSFIGMGNQWGKTPKADRIKSINSTLEKLSEKQLIIASQLITEVEALEKINFNEIRAKQEKDYFQIIIFAKQKI